MPRSLTEYYREADISPVSPPEKRKKDDKTKAEPKEKPVDGSVAYYQDLLERGNIALAKKWLEGKTLELQADELSAKTIELIEAMVKHSIPDPDIIAFIHRQPEKIQDTLNDVAVKTLKKKNGLIF